MSSSDPVKGPERENHPPVTSSPPSPTPRACPDALLGGFKLQLQDVSAKGRKGQGWGSRAPPSDVSNEANLEVAGKAGVGSRRGGGTRRGGQGWREAGPPGAPRNDSEVEASAGTWRGHPPLDVAAEAVELPVEAHAAVAEDVEATARRRGSPGAGHHELVAAQLEGAGLQAQQLCQRQQGQLAVARPQAAQLPRRDGGQARPGGRRARHLRHAPARGALGLSPLAPAAGARPPAAPQARRRESGSRAAPPFYPPWVRPPAPPGPRARPRTLRTQLASGWNLARSGPAAPARRRGLLIPLGSAAPHPGPGPPPPGRHRRAGVGTVGPGALGLASGERGANPRARETPHLRGPMGGGASVSPALPAWGPGVCGRC